MTEKSISSSVQQKRRTKRVHNRSGHRVELLIEGKVVVLQPRTVVEVPLDFDIPNGLGLYVK